MRLRNLPLIGAGHEREGARVGDVLGKVADELQRTAQALVDRPTLIKADDPRALAAKPVEWPQLARPPADG